MPCGRKNKMILRGRGESWYSLSRLDTCGNSGYILDPASLMFQLYAWFLYPCDLFDMKYGQAQEARIPIYAERFNLL